ncbi:MAG: FemAB family PEP-CTERM system-associated protein [Cellvibrionaceae bacterium]
MNQTQVDSSLTALKKKIKEKSREKQLCAKAFKTIDKTSHEFTTLKDKMSGISADLKALESDLKKQLNQDTLAPQAPKELLPARFISTPPNRDSSISKISECFDQKKWDEYVQQHPLSSPYHLYRWQLIISESFKHNASYLSAFDRDNNIIGVLPIIWQNTQLFGKHGISMPYFNYGDPLADNEAISLALLNHGNKIRQRLGFSHLEIRTTNSNITKNKNIPYQNNKISMILALPKTITELKQGIGSKIRAQLKQCENFELTYKEGGQELIDDFYRVYSTNMRDLGTPVYSKSFFQSIFKHSPQNCSISLLYHKGEPVSTGFLIAYKDVLEIPWASTLRKANFMQANMFLYWNILQGTISKGFKFFDFGRSSKDSNTYRFKKQWGAKPVEHYWYYMMEDGENLPEINPNNPKYKLLITLWKKLPVLLANLIGPWVAKDLP